MQRSGASRPGGRTALTRQRVHAAVRELLEQTPDAPLHMGQVAASSGVNPATLYRRWGSIDALILDVVVDDLTDRSPLVATGDLRADLLQYAARVQVGLRRPDGLHFLKALIAATGTPDGHTAARTIAQRRLDEFDALLSAHHARCLDPLDVVHGIVAPLTYQRLIAPHTNLEHHDLERLVDTLLAGAAARDRRPTSNAGSSSP